VATLPFHQIWYRTGSIVRAGIQYILKSFPVLFVPEQAVVQLVQILDAAFPAIFNLRKSYIPEHCGVYDRDKRNNSITPNLKEE
jgi:hypothetical protein